MVGWSPCTGREEGRGGADSVRPDTPTREGRDPSQNGYWGQPRDITGGRRGSRPCGMYTLFAAAMSCLFWWIQFWTAARRVRFFFFFDFHLLGYICLTAFSAVAIFIFAPMGISTIDIWFPGDPAFLFMTQSTSYPNPSSMRLENTSPVPESYLPNIENPMSQTRRLTSARTPMKLPMETRRRLPLVRLAMTTVVGCRWCAATTFHYSSPISIRQESSINLL